MKQLTFVLILLAFPALAQQSLPDPAMLQRATQVLQQQRNQAMDAAANCDIRAATISEELEKVKKELADLKAKEAPK